MRSATSVFARIDPTTLCLTGFLFGLLAYFVFRRSRVAACLLFVACVGIAFVTPEIPRVVGIFAALATFGAIRATILLRPNTSQERTREG